jgi:hypothetical protein
MVKLSSLVVLLSATLCFAVAPASIHRLTPPQHFVWFEENTGQATDGIAFIGHGFSVPLALMKDGSLALDTGHGLARLAPNRASRLRSFSGELPTGGLTRSYAPGARTTARHFQRVRFANLWPGADLFYRIRDGQLELGMDVRPGRSWSVPSLRWKGAHAQLDAQGRLLVTAGGLSFVLRQPSAVQPGRANREHPVAVSYALGPGGELKFRVVGANPALPLTIDPLFDFSTYLGGSELDSIYGMALGPDGSIYLTGQTASPSLFGRTTGDQSGSGKALVMRLAPGGIGVVYFAVIGGSYNDQGQAIAVDANGNAYATGYTDSPDFLTTANAFQTTMPGEYNAFAMKLDPSGDLLYSTFLGGSGADYGLAIAVDGMGRAVVAGQTSSSDYPVTASAYQKSFAGADDCFITQLSPDGTSAVFSTFLGGSDLDGCHGVDLDSSGNITVAGATRSANFPVLGAFQSASGGFLDGFVAQLSSDGSTLLSSSYLGGIGQDQIAAVALDSSGDVYVAGSTSEQNGFPGTGTGVVTTTGTGTKGFACMISPGLVALNWCSIVGGSGNDYVYGMALQPSGNVVVAGQTTSIDLPVQNALKYSFQGMTDGWFAILAAAGNQWQTVSYSGGSGTNTVYATQAMQDRILLAGATTSTNFPVTSGAIQPTPGGDGDGFLQEVAMANDMVLNGIYPLSGIGLTHVLNLVVTNPNGGLAIQSIQVNVSNPYSNASACSVSFGISAQTITLINDAGTAIVGSAVLGSSVTLQNSQCTVNAANAAITIVGNAVAVRLSLTYAAAFSSVGAGVTKYVNVVATDNQGNTLSVVQAASWELLAPQPPVAVSVTPSSGLGLSQTFALAVSDASGANDLSSVLLLFANSTGLSSACAVTYIAQQKILGLTNDAGTGYAGYVTPGQAGSVSNSQCTLNGSGSSIQTSGNALTMTVSLQFSTAFASTGTGAAKTIYAYPVNSAGQGPTGGIAMMGSWSIPTPPTVVSLAPASGQGASQTFTLTVSDPAGANDLASVQLLFANSTSLSSACAVTYIAQQKNLGLTNDAGTGYAGYVTPGQAGSVSNSQCTLNGSGSSIQSSGNSLLMAVSLQFSTAFASVGTGAAKTIYAAPVNSAGQGPSGGMVAMGTWTIPAPGSPTVVSLSPSSGQNTSQAFVLTVSDTSGASDLSSVQLLFANSTSLISACAVTYIAQQKNLGLTNDAGTGYAGYVTPGQTGSVSNSQCTLNGSGSSIQTSGNSLIMTASLLFNTAFASTGTSAAKTVYANPLNSAGKGPTGGMVAIGTWTVPTPPAAVSLTPASGQGLSQIFVLTVSDLAGGGDLATVQLLFANSTSLSSACAVTYVTQQKNLGLTNDAGTGYAGYVTPGQSGSVSNSQCTLNGSGSSIQISGNSLIMTVNLQFATAFASVGTGAAKTMYANPVNSAGQGPSGGMAAMGTWTIPKAGTPAVASVSPSSGIGSSQTFVLTASDTAGATDLASVQLLFANSTSLSKACAVTYSAQQKNLGLTNNAGTGYAGYVTPGQSSSVSNSQCVLSGSGSSIKTSGNTVTMSVSLQFEAAFATAGTSAAKTIYGNAVNSAGQAPSGGMAKLGTWNIPTTPTVVSLTPSSGQGSSKAFALTVSDTAGASDLASSEIIFSSADSLSAACVVVYLSQQKQFGLLNDAGSNYVAYVTPGASSSISNSQCTLSGSGSSVKTSGNNLTTTVNLQFKSAFKTSGSATKTVYAYPVSAEGLAPSNWVTMGSWTVE